MEKFKYLLKNKFSKLPKNSGVYVFKNKEILYIGKALNIRERVKNHFQQPGFKESLFLDKTKKIGYIKTDSEIEALILEANLIKKCQPKYNVLWRDDKNYFYIGITEEDFPRIFITHQLKNLKSEILNLKSFYVGPFVDGTALKQTLKVLRKVFPYRSCRILPKRPCLWYQLNRCLAPCLLKSGVGKQIPVAFSQIKRECQRNTKNILRIFKDKRSQVLKDLKKEMKTLSKLQDFEKAAKIRDQIKTLERIFSHAKVFETLEIERPEYSKIEKDFKKLFRAERKIERIEAYDVSNIQGKLATGAMVTFINGKVNKDFYRHFKIKIAGKPNDLLMIKEVLDRRLKHLEWGLPDLILIDGGIAQLNVALKIKDQRSKIKNIKIISLAKKENKLYIENQKAPILLKNLPREIFNLVLQLRDEAHRFALSYHKKLRYKNLLKN